MGMRVVGTSENLERFQLESFSSSCFSGRSTQNFRISRCSDVYFQLKVNQTNFYSSIEPNYKASVLMPLRAHNRVHPIAT